MFSRSSAAVFTALSILLCGISASAETLRCQSVNGNVNCAGSGAISCQTIDSKKVCVSGHGDVVQSFGDGTSTDSDLGNGGDDLGTGADDAGNDNPPPGPTLQQRFERQDSPGRTLLLQRQGSELHLRSDWLSIDRD